MTSDRLPGRSRGRFITFEGGEGVGKSTQTQLLGEALTKRGLSVVLTREPGGTDGAEAIRRLLLDPEGDGWDARSEALLFAAARADHVERLIRPALERGAWVMCDRFIDSSRAYQGGEGGLNDHDIMALHHLGSLGLLPDLTLLLMAEERTVAARLATRDELQGSDRIGSRTAAFHRMVAQRFERLATSEPNRFQRIEASGDPQAIHEQVLAALDTRFDTLRSTGRSTT